MFQGINQGQKYLREWNIRENMVGIHPTLEDVERE